MHEQGNISISAENMFPIIKKWLYSEKDIFVRELTSNASDAISKLQRLCSIAQASVDDTYRINVTADSEKFTLSFEDNGIGMTAEEVKKYINQVAFSGAQDFFEKYQESEGDQIIGHFGLGFYSAFMVAKKVTIDTLSYVEGSEAVRWESEGGMEFTLSASDRTTRGTCITLELDDDNHEFANKWTVRETLMKYFRFLPTPIYLYDAKDERKEDDKPLNDAEPLWNKNPSDCTEEEYKAFYHSVFMDMADPLFWVHLNIDYPFRLKGILYFPKLKHEMESIEGQVKLYCNQVFVADNIKEVIPEYLLLLKGCIDCPDLPLNVSRSFLQNDGTVTKLSGHITRKVGDRLMGLYNTERENYDKYWDDINPFIKYGCLRDEKFYDRVKKALLFKTIDGAYLTVDEYLASNAKVEEHECHCGEEDHECTCGHEHGDDHECEKKSTKIVYYVSSPEEQAQYVSMFRANGIAAVVLNHMLDSHFISFLEYKLAEQNVRFKRIDSDLSDLVTEVDAEANFESVEALYREISGASETAEADKPKFVVTTAPLMGGAAPAVMTLSEESRRMEEMAKMMGGNNPYASMFAKEENLVINTAHPLTGTVAELLAAGRTDDAKLIARQVYDLARIAQKPLSADEMTEFIARSAEILGKIKYKRFFL